MMLIMRLDELICLIVWSSSVFYSLYRFIVSTKDINSLNLSHTDFDDGWLVSRKRDVTDFEWLVYKQTVIKHYLLVAGHVLLSQLVWRYAPQLSKMVFIIYGSLAVGLILSPLALVIIWCNILVTFFIRLFNYRLLCYSAFIVSLFLIHQDLFGPDKLYLFGLDESRKLLMEVSLAWLNAKCLSLTIDSFTHSSFNILNSPLNQLTYCLYFPSFFNGPICNYFNFVKDLESRSKWCWSTLVESLTLLLRYFWWILVFELLLHYLYPSSIQYYPFLCDNFDSWTLCGFGYSLSCLFHLKYFILYGTAGALAKMDGINLPPPPKCVTRMHLSSHLWRYFDRGLHLWLTQYFYKPILACKGNIGRKIFASAVCFFCVGLWHGMNKTIIIWCLLNFLCVSFEFLGLLLRKYLLNSKLKITLSPYSERHLKAATSSPFFLIMIISNIFFLASYEVGACFVRRVFFSFPYPILPILIIFYTACYISLYFIES